MHARQVSAIAICIRQRKKKRPLTAYGYARGDAECWAVVYKNSRLIYEYMI